VQAPAKGSGVRKRRAAGCHGPAVGTTSTANGALLRIFASLDARVTFGLGDQVFERGGLPEKAQSSLHASFEMSNPLGNGITRVLSSNHELSRTWVSAALAQLDACTAFVSDFPKLGPVRKALIGAARNVLERGPTSLSISLWALGVAWLDSEWSFASNLPDTPSQSLVALLVFRAVEHSAYFEEVSACVLNTVDELIEAHDARPSSLCAITRRSAPRLTPWEVDREILCSSLMESFTLCAIAEALADEGLVEHLVSVADAASRAPQRLPFQSEGDIIFGWAAMGLCPKGTGYVFARNERFLLQLLLIANTQLEASRLVENLLAQRLTASVQDAPERLQLSGVELARIRALAASVSERTTSRAVSLRGDVRSFLDQFAEAAKTHEYNASILEKGEALYAVYRDLLLDRQPESKADLHPTLATDHLHAGQRHVRRSRFAELLR
jgi:hypothetical protein